MRRRLKRLRSLSRAQRRVVLVSAFLLPSVQASLRIRGFKRTAATLAARSRRKPISGSPADARPAAEAVAMVAGRSVVGARCLGRSLVLWFLLRRRGIDAELVLGAVANGTSEFLAHAWVEVDGKPVNDTPDVRERYGSFGLQLPRLVEPGQA
jgi:hypothetical protein